MSNIAKTTGSAPALNEDLAAKLMRGIGESRATTVIGSGGKPFLRLLRHGVWVYGQEDMDVQEGSRWVVNPLSIQHGYSCWTKYDDKRKNELLGEAMTPIWDAKPAHPEPINGFGWGEQRSIELKCITGEDEGIEVTYKISSTGGMRAIDGLLSDMQSQLANNRAFPCPVLELEVDSYQHTSWGKVFVPELKLVGWADMNGNVMPEGGAKAVAAPADAGVAKTVGRGRAPVAAAAEAAPAKRTRAAAPKPVEVAPAEVEAEDPPFEEAEEVETAAQPEPAPQRAGVPRRRPGQR